MVDVRQAPAEVHGMIGSFETPLEVLHAAEKVRNAGFKRFEVYSPFPIHGMDRAMGIPDTKLPWIVLVMGITGCMTAVGLQFFANGIELDTALTYLTGYKYIVSGKPAVTIVPFVPIIFELTVLLSAFGAVFGMLALNGLPRWNHSVFNHAEFSRVTDDRFFICIEAEDTRYDAVLARRLLESAGARGVAEVAG